MREIDLLSRACLVKTRLVKANDEVLSQQRRKSVMPVSSLRKLKPRPSSHLKGPRFSRSEWLLLSRLRNLPVKSL